MIAVSDGRGTRWIIPVLAAKEATANVAGAAATTSGAAGAGSSSAGLWVGVAVVQKVSEPQSGSMNPLPTSGQGNVCAGGEAHGLWFQLVGAATGPSSSNSVDPSAAPLWKPMFNNTFHSSQTGVKGYVGSWMPSAPSYLQNNTMCECPDLTQTRT